MVKVELTKVAYKSLKKLPLFIVDKLTTWISQVELLGLSEVRKRPGFHDEPLQGKRFGQRSIRLNRQYRAIYKESDKSSLITVTIIEVNKHEY